MADGAGVEVPVADRFGGLADLGDEPARRVPFLDVLRAVDDDFGHPDELVAVVQRGRGELDVFRLAVPIDHRAGVAVAVPSRVAALDVVHVVGGLGRVEHLVGEGVGPAAVRIEQLRDVAVADRVLAVDAGERGDRLVPLGDVAVPVEDERRDPRGVEHLLEAGGG